VTSPTLTRETTLLRHPSAVVGPLPGETILLRVDTGTTLRLNATATWIWEQLAEPMELGELADRLAAHYVIDMERADEDARRLAADLVEREFVQLA